MVLWFVTLAVLGLRQIAQNPAVLAAAIPVHAVALLPRARLHGFLVLGAVVLVITGGEALYADMGHFGRAPIRLAWYASCCRRCSSTTSARARCSSSDPSAATNPFYALVPGALIYPLVVLSTMATVIASQALISGAFSLTQQAVQLGFFPRVTIVHTSSEAEGQIYIPEINSALAVACIGLVLSFQESSALAAAYGIAVTGTMAITSIVYYVVLTRDVGLAALQGAAARRAFLVFDLAFFGANLLKFFDGGWFPIAVAVAIFMMMTTWKSGRALLAQNIADQLLPLERVPRRPGHAQAAARPGHGGVHVVEPQRRAHRASAPLQAQPGAAREGRAALRHLRERARGPVAQARSACTSSGKASFTSTAYYGFMETPNVPEIMRQRGRAARALRAGARPATTSGRETLLAIEEERHAALAKVALLVHLAQLALGHAVLRHSRRPRGRARHADRSSTS